MFPALRPVANLLYQKTTITSRVPWLLHISNCLATGACYHWDLWRNHPLRDIITSRFRWFLSIWSCLATDALFKDVFPSLKSTAKPLPWTLIKNVETIDGWRAPTGCSLMRFAAQVSATFTKSTIDLFFSYQLWDSNLMTLLQDKRTSNTQDSSITR